MEPSREIFKDTSERGKIWQNTSTYCLINAEITSIAVWKREEIDPKVIIGREEHFNNFTNVLFVVIRHLTLEGYVFDDKKAEGENLAIKDVAIETSINSEKDPASFSNCNEKVFSVSPIASSITYVEQNSVKDVEAPIVAW